MSIQVSTPVGFPPARAAMVQKDNGYTTEESRHKTIALYVTPRDTRLRAMSRCMA